MYKVSEIILVNFGAHEKAIFSAKSEVRRTITFKWGMILQVSNMIISASDVSIPKSRIKYDVLLDAKEVGSSSNSLLDHAKWWVSISKYFIKGRVSLLNSKMSLTYSSKVNL